MKKKTDQQKRVKHRECCAFAWQNFTLTGIAVAFIVAGCLLMLPETDVRNTVGGRYAPAPSPGTFDARRIKVAPIPCFIGFVLMIPTIMYVPKNVKREEMKSENHTK